MNLLKVCDALSQVSRSVSGYEALPYVLAGATWSREIIFPDVSCALPSCLLCYVPTSRRGLMTYYELRREVVFFSALFVKSRNMRERVDRLTRP